MRTVYVGGQNAVNASGAIVGKGDMAAQAEQTFRNLESVLAAAGAGPEHVAKWTVHVVHGTAWGPGFQVFQRVWDQRPNPPAITVLFVAGLAHSDFLLELDAIAVVPDAS